MKSNAKIMTVAAAGALIALCAMSACGKSDGKSSASAKTTESGVVTNDNGSVSRTYTERNVTTNGNMVTERRRETRTTMDAKGNVLESSTSEYAQSYPVGDVGLVRMDGGEEASGSAAESFLSLKFGEKFESEEFDLDADEPVLLRAKFTPAKPLAEFDDYYVYVTPTTHRIAKICACAKKPVESEGRGRRHYLIEALERRYGTWARLCSFSRPRYAFDLGEGRWVIACLDGAARDYATVLVAGDESVIAAGAEETEALRAERRKSAEARRRKLIEETAAGF